MLRSVRLSVKDWNYVDARGGIEFLRQLIEGHRNPPDESYRSTKTPLTPIPPSYRSTKTNPASDSELSSPNNRPRLNPRVHRPPDLSKPVGVCLLKSDSKSSGSKRPRMGTETRVVVLDPDDVD